jgi:protease I
LGSQAKILKEKGAIFEKKPVVFDGKIITANGPGAAEEFGKTIVELLTKE